VIVAGGLRTSLPHAQPSDRAIGEGDLLMLDFGASVGGYCCDITRTVVVGEASAWQRDLHAAVREAQEAAIQAARADCPAADVDQAARKRLARYDWDTFFGHSTGHGIGLEVHEDPRLSSRSPDVLVPGHVVTVEPGVYLPDRGGVRIEDDVWVREAGPELITGFTRRLLEL
jgi:Xaa-Pro aminopeptidase